MIKFIRLLLRFVSMARTEHYRRLRRRESAARRGEADERRVQRVSSKTPAQSTFAQPVNDMEGWSDAI